MLTKPTRTRGVVGTRFARNFCRSFAIVEGAAHSASALNDADTAAAWYEAQRPGLGRRNAEQLSPIAQALLFYGILFKNESQFDRSNRNPTRLSGGLGYSAMSVGRAFDELATAGLAAVEKRGRSKTITFDADGRSIIDRARTLLRNPVRSRKFVHFPRKIPPMKIAGESALANLTGLSPPRLPTYAIHADDWPEVSSASDVVDATDQQEAGCALELWYYDPEVLSNDATVDPLSLFAQFRDDPNERIAEAAAEALEHVPW